MLFQKKCKYFKHKYSSYWPIGRFGEGQGGNAPKITFCHLTNKILYRNFNIILQHKLPYNFKRTVPQTPSLSRSMICPCMTLYYILRMIRTYSIIYYIIHTYIHTYSTTMYTMHFTTNLGQLHLLVLFLAASRWNPAQAKMMVKTFLTSLPLQLTCYTWWGREWPVLTSRVSNIMVWTVIQN